MKRTITYNTKTNVPEIVNEKCNAAFEQIRLEAKSAPKKIYHRKKATFAAIAVAAAVACAVPVAADYFRGGFEVVSTEFYHKDPAKQVNLQEYADNVNVEAEHQLADMSVQSVFSDGKSLSIAFTLDPKDEDLKRMTQVAGDFTIHLNGRLIKPYVDTDSMPIWFEKADDGIFYATVDFPEEVIDETSTLDIKAENLYGYNGKLYTWTPFDPNDYYGEGEYTCESIGPFDDVYEFSTTVTPNTDNNTLYEINETQGNHTLENVLVTPFKTEVTISGLTPNSYVTVFDNEGNEIEQLYNTTHDNGTWDFSTPLKTANQLKISVYPSYDAPEAECTFTVDIEKGFADVYTVEFDESEIVYVPPFEEIYPDGIAEDAE